ncbi:MAG: hypothetical protein QM500_02860 [Methylococcales bacterium]
MEPKPTIKKPKQIALDGEYLKFSEQVESEKPPETNSAEPVIPTSELIEPIVQMCAGVLVPNWKLQKAEIKVLAEAYGSLLDKYFPDTGKLMGVELNALLITAAVIVPRIGTPIKEPPPKPETEKQVDDVAPEQKRKKYKKR